MMPQNVATQTPFLKLNSLTVAFLSASVTSRSLATPANPLMTMPNKHTITPPITTRLCGTLWVRVASRFVQYSTDSIPSIGGMAGREPVATTSRS